MSNTSKGGFTLTLLGRELRGTWPDNATIWSAGERDAAALKKLAVAALPDLPALVKETQKTAVYLKVGTMILMASGLIGPLEEVLESELEDEDPAVKAWAEALGKGFGKRSPLHLIRHVRKSPAFEARFLLREPHEKEIDLYLRDESLGPSTELLKKLCVWGDVEDAVKHAPGLPRALCFYLLEKAGLSEALTLGEA